MPAPDDFEVAEGFKVGESWIVRLDIDVARDLLQRGEHLQPVRVHGRVAGPECKVVPDLLEPVECRVKDGEAALEHSAVPEVLDVPGVDCVGKLTDLGTRAITWNTFAILGLQSENR